MKLLVLCSSLDLRYPASCTPAWWQLLKALREIGTEVVAAPYQGPAIESPWWRCYDNPCRLEGDIFRRIKRLAGQARGPVGEEFRRKAKETPFEKFIRIATRVWIRPKWQRHLHRILRDEGDVAAVLSLSVPPNHLVGLPRSIKRKHPIPFFFYDGDVPGSLPRFQGFALAFRIYKGADLSEYDGFFSNSQGGIPELEALGATNVYPLYYAADPDLFAPVETEQDIDVFFYGHGSEFRADWINAMIRQPSEAMPDVRFAVRATGMDRLIGNAEALLYSSFSKLREYSHRSKINLCITRKAHTSVYASSSARPFELAAMGCCIVSNPYLGIEEWFEPGKELLIVNNAEEAIETYRDLLSHPEKRKALGRAARERVLQEHTYRHRARQLVEVIADTSG
ncbi:MAG: hypothetical protein AUJ92_05590 [Armatimonadetes bacterium CG2_30_59_28]|nr:glycosyltransferase [Armatimonadota bacterium]OIO96637.1 MAG: hypothetical protein AUJ92_05590 [Armatimonadetes bacterium CG2_30_59_28]PIU67085.1 MAG: hypothetical protein COS85_02095 [Armatimonadetes bacterium CG07_land_8_20_14_0_80_59_28]